MNIKHILSLFLLAFSTLTFGVTIDNETLTANFSLTDRFSLNRNGDNVSLNTSGCESNLRKAKLNDVERCYNIRKMRPKAGSEAFSQWTDVVWFHTDANPATVYEFSNKVSNGLRDVKVYAEADWRKYVESKRGEFNQVVEKQREQQLEQQRNKLAQDNEVKANELETLRRHGGVQTMGYEKLCLSRSPQTYRCEVTNDYETEVKLNIRNDSSAKIKDINLECFGYTKTDTPVSGQRVTVYEFIEPNSTLSTSVKLKLVDNVAGFRCFKAK